jgi:UDP-2,4-diacetamido-2,4,6-trideoxy-beta-L-altropyranose hydrolase
MIGLLIERLSRAQLLDQIMLATSTDPSNDALAEYIQEQGYPVFRGNEEDVLDRYFHAAKEAGAAVVVRVTGDCPLIDPNVVDTVIRAREREQVDYASNTMPPTFPNGLDVEVFRFDVLEEAWRKAKGRHEREHVTPYLRQSENFTRYNVSHSEDLSTRRWVIDEPEDLQVVKMVFEHFYPRRDFGWLEVLALSRASPERFMANQHHVRNQGSQLSANQKLRKRAKRVIFRADAAHALGYGHVMRCLTLAGALREREAEVLFVCREHDGHLCDLISEVGFDVARLPAPDPSFEGDGDLEHGSWLGASWQEDAEQTRVAMSGTASWIIADHYAIDWRWERAVRTMADQIFAIDDLADRDHECDLLLDQNLVHGMDQRYLSKVPASCKLLLGPKYALLHPLYQELHDAALPLKPFGKRGFLFMGGGDQGEAVDVVLKALFDLPATQEVPHIDLVLPTGHSLSDMMSKRIEKSHVGVHIHTSLPALAPLMAKADWAIGGGGTTNWERLCLGLPTLVWSRAENQRAIAQELHERGLVRWLGHGSEVTQETVHGALVRLLNDGSAGRLESWSLRCLAEVDGRGVNRVYSAMAVTD